MSKRLEKRHKRQVARAKANVKLSEPDVRTAEQIKADREASRPSGSQRGGPAQLYNSPVRSAGGRSAGTAKTDA